MKKLFVLGFAIAASSFFIGCDNGENGNTNTITHKSHNELREEVIGLRDATTLQHPGKIYTKDQYLLIGEIGKGVHVFDNTDPRSPKNLAFIQIPGNVDVAIKGDVIYADNFMDLVTLNAKTGKVTRVKNAFKNHEERRRDEVLALNNGKDPLGMKGTQFQAVNHGSPGGNPVGTGGSMARFAIVGDHLYVLDENTMKVFDITDPDNPVKKNEIEMDFVVETIFPHEDKLFIGGTQGMYIYDNTDPAMPRLLSQFEHAIACDPVVVSGSYAYVTLREGGPCGRSSNQLDVVDISTITNPTLVKSFQMHSPAGLSVQNNVLFLCDGNQGLKVFDVTDKENISGNLLFRDNDIRKAYDVIASSGSPVVIVVGKEGLYQYDASNPESLEKLSEITIEKEKNS
ncbi:MAG: hypothetical protein GY810_20170 [Aureispira sp.]|nr:hypothetical protein [Aureispira sp.]